MTLNTTFKIMTLDQKIYHPNNHTPLNIFTTHFIADD
jgi:hypothetical protein